MNRRWIALLLSCVLLLTLAAACGKSDESDKTDNDNMQDNATPNNPTPNVPTPSLPGNNTGSDGQNNSGTTPSTPDDDRGEYPTFPNVLADANADVALDDLIDTLGLTATDLETAMRDVATVGDNVEGAKTYRHKLLGHESDVSYGFNDEDMIDRVTVKAGKDRMEDWRKELNDVLNATAADGEADTWDYSDSRVKITEQGEHILITIEKPEK